MQRAGEGFVLELVESARKTISEGYYRGFSDAGLPRRSLLDAVTNPRNPPALITEVKYRSPAEGALRLHGDGDDVGAIARAYERGGAAGISVLTEPKHFEGRLEYLTRVKRSVSLPVLMKDVVVDVVQIDAGRLIGADAVLLMASVFANDLASSNLEQMIDHAHGEGLEVLLEAHTDEEFEASLRSKADLIGINNRDLKTLKVSLDVSRNLLKKYRTDRPVICESGISTRDEIIELHSLGGRAFLVGSAIMRSPDVEAAVRALSGAR